MRVGVLRRERRTRDEVKWGGVDGAGAGKNRSVAPGGGEVSNF